MSPEMKFSEAQLTHLLETAPAVDVPADFAVRVRERLPLTLPKRRAAEASRVVAIVSAVLIAAVLFVLAPHAQGSAQNLAFWMEMLLLVELGGIAWWLAVRRGSVG